jgi:hypothetical protein
MSGSPELNLAALKSAFIARLSAFSPGMLVAVAGRPGSGIERLLNSLTVSDMDSFGFPIRLERMDWQQPWNERRDTYTERLLACRDWANEVGGLIVVEVNRPGTSSHL